MIEALAADYDGTLAWQGKVLDSTIASLHRLKNSGRKFVLVTGRRIDDLMTVFPHFSLCDLIVGENGALLYWPKESRTEMLCPVAPQNFVRILYERGVPPLAVGKAIIAMKSSQATEVGTLIVEQGLDLKMIFNKDAMMLLPAGVDKGTGVRTALSLLESSARRTVGVGDAENDEPLLKACGIGVAVENALTSLKAIATFSMEEPHGLAIEKLIDWVIDGSLDHYVT